jgi:hypothetical protein
MDAERRNNEYVKSLSGNRSWNLIGSSTSTPLAFRNCHATIANPRAVAHVQSNQILTAPSLRRKAISVAQHGS